jgi:hypothetical protein
VKGEGYVDIPRIERKPDLYLSQLDFSLDTSLVGNSEMQHLDFAYATSLIRTFVEDDSLVLTIRGRKYTPAFDFFVGKHKIKVKGVQTEVDAGYEGKNQVVLIEAKSTDVTDTIIRQMFYPFKQWKHHTDKKIALLFFEKFRTRYLFWQFEFTDINDYNSISLVKTGVFAIES